MRRATWTSMIAVTLLIVSAAPLAAHHSFSAEFGVNKPFKLTGVVTKVAWANPSSQGQP